MSIRRAIAWSLMMLALAVEPGLCRIWHVQADGKGDAPTIQAAMDKAQPGDEVLLGPGVYSWTSQGASGESMVHMRPGVSLRSSSGASATTLDAEQQGRVIFCAGTGDVTIGGITVRNGRVTRSLYPLFPFAGGAGIASDATSHPTITSCVIRENWLDNTELIGGGVFCVTATIEDSQIESNRGSYQSRGGGVACSGRLHMSRTVIRNHRLGGDNLSQGAGVWAMYAVIEGCEFDTNDVSGTYSAAGGAVLLGGGRISNSRFVRNSLVVDRGSTASPFGAAVHCYGCSISTSVFVGNRNTGGRFPGLAAVTGGDTRQIRIDRCTFIGNESLSLSGILDDYDIAGVAANNALVTASIFAFNRGKPVYHVVETRCSDFFGNTRGNDEWGVDGGGSFSLDPLFCVVDSTGVATPWIQKQSPCAPGQHPDAVACGVIGAADPGCSQTPVVRETLSRVKQIFR